MANCLNLNDRNRHIEELRSRVCGAEYEDLAHFILDCEGLREERERITELQRPHIEDRKKIIKNVLFETERIEKRKEQIYRMWKKRGKRS